jgi:hypothetical protein
MFETAALESCAMHAAICRAALKTPTKFFCSWDDSKSVTEKLGAMSKSALKTYA